MSQFLNTVKDVTKNYKTYDKWEQSQADKMAKKDHLVNNLGVNKDKLEITRDRAQAVIRATEIMDARSENNCENVEQVIGMVSGIPLAGVTVAEMKAPEYIDKLLKNKIQSKIEKLKSEIKIGNLSNEIIAQKEGEIQNLTQKMNKTLTKSTLLSIVGGTVVTFAMFVALTLWGNSQQKLASRIGRFQAKQDELKDIENFISYTPEQLAEAEEIAKNLPDKKEKNSFMQALQELKEMQASRSDYKKWAKQKDPKELEKLKAKDVSKQDLITAKADKELITNTVSEINIKAEEYSENLENAFDTIGTLSWLAAIPTAFGLNKILSKFTHISSSKGKLISSITSFMVALGISMAGTFEQKNASRVGRYHARQDLLKNPHKLMSFTDEEMSLANDIKAPKQKKNLFKKIGESFVFLKDYYKHKSEYKKYKNTTQKHNEKLQEAFKQIETTDTQKAEAKILQTNVFRAFDEVDEMSQRYSEDIEASTEIAKNIFTNLWQLGSAAGMILVPIGIYKGKIPLLTPIKKIADWTLKKDSSIKLGIDKLYQAIKNKGKGSAKEIQNELFKGNIKSYLEKAENTEIKSALSNLGSELEQLSINKINSGIQETKPTNFIEQFETILKDHFKQSPLSKWARKFSLEGLKFKTRSSFKNDIKAQIDLAKKENPNLTKAEIDKLWSDFKQFERENGLELNFKNYKTLALTGIGSVVPGLALLFTVPYVFNSWLTDIQKKAGRIGVMKAMQNLDDPKIFANVK